MASLIDLSQLSWRFQNAGAALFEGLSLSIAPGEFVAIVGGSGVGKSTLLRLVNGLLPASSGQVRLNTRPAPGRREQAIVFQDARLMPWRSVRGNIRFALQALGLDKNEIERRIDSVLSLTGLTKLGGRWPHQLSGGQAQRVGIARALAVEPAILLMDEPFSAIDALTRASLQTELLRIWQQTQAAVLFVTHDLDEATLLADRVVVLGGSPARVVEDRVIQLPRPRNRQTAEFHREVAALADCL
jgi:NitT/TauT family transport system ATP-binding protein